MGMQCSKALNPAATELLVLLAPFTGRSVERECLDARKNL